MYSKKIVLLSIGDPLGIGPEICIKACLNKTITQKCSPVIVGDIDVLKKTSKKKNIYWNIVKYPLDIQIKKNTINVFNAQKYKIKNIKIHKPAKISGLASFNYIQEAINLIKKNWTNILVTAPISKQSWELANLKYHAHTEALADITKTKKYAMIFVNNRARVILLTRHIPISLVAKNINKKTFEESINLGVDFLNSIGIKKKRIGICGLNPHAGDDGIIGNEEKLILKPVIKKITNADIIGPESADSIFYKMLNNKIDLVIAMYHDQGIVPLKAISYYTCVNITWGLPIIRTSPGHGTAFDIAGKNIANETSMIEAILWALKIKK
jgi:4-phospho-D-threonate 3-dehydrogenase / 4-phospho-D-erythronate 3-dehydrogenase